MRATASEHERVNLLLVDDRPGNLQSLQALLARPDYNLVVAQSGTEALAQVLRQEFALIVLDVAMPGMDGFEVAALIKEREQSMHIPIIFVTASAFDIDEILRGYTIGAVDYLRKPLDAHAVRSKVAVFVELYRQRKQIERQAERLREAELREQRRQRELAEEALRESESLYQLTCEEALIGIAHAGPDARLTRVNRYLGELRGEPIASLLGRCVDELVVPSEAPAIVEQLAQLHQGGAAYRGEHRLARVDGVWVELTLSALRDADARLRQFIIVANDITARKQGELERARVVRELQEGIRARDDFLSLAAHELKTPSTPLRLQAESLLRLLEREVDLSAHRATLARRLETLCRASQRLDALVDHLLSLSNLTVAKVPLHREPLDLVQLVREVVARMRFDADRSGSSLELAARGEVMGEWDRLRVAQVIENLIGNAIKYGAGRPVSITVSGEDELARVSVEDAGVGIPAAALERIFERFERVAPLAHYGGFGVGLWIVRRIVEAHGGHVHAASEPGKGSRFTIELPRGEPTPTERAAP